MHSNVFWSLELCVLKRHNCNSNSGTIAMPKMKRVCDAVIKSETTFKNDQNVYRVKAHGAKSDTIRSFRRLFRHFLASCRVLLEDNKVICCAFSGSLVRLKVMSYFYCNITTFVKAALLLVVIFILFGAFAFHWQIICTANCLKINRHLQDLFKFRFLLAGHNNQS